MKGKKGKVVLGPSDTKYFSVDVAFPAHSALLSLSGKVPCFGIVSKVITSCFMMMGLMMWKQFKSKHHHNCIAVLSIAFHILNLVQNQNCNLWNQKYNILNKNSYLNKENVKILGRSVSVCLHCTFFLIQLEYKFRPRHLSFVENTVLFLCFL